MTVVFMRFHGQDSAYVYISGSADPETAAFECYRVVCDSQATHSHFIEGEESGDFSYTTTLALAGTSVPVGHLL